MSKTVRVVFRLERFCSYSKPTDPTKNLQGLRDRNLSTAENQLRVQEFWFFNTLFGVFTRVERERIYALAKCLCVIKKAFQISYEPV